jgi:hypothetical protein
VSVTMVQGLPRMICREKATGAVWACQETLPP